MTSQQVGVDGVRSGRCDSHVELRRCLAAAGWPPTGREAKGDAGQVVVIGGSVLYPGPPYLAALAALRIGVDDVRVIAPNHAVGIRLLLETHVHRGGGQELDADTAAAVLRRTVTELLARRRTGACGRVVVLIGPGMGGHPQPGPLLAALADVRAHHGTDISVLVDGHLGGGTTGNDRIAMMHPDIVLLSGGEATGLLSRRPPLSLAETAASLGAVLVAKGPVDHVYGPTHRGMRPPADGAIELTKSGTGDVMAGAVAALLARGLKPFDAATAGCWLMQAASRTARAQIGPGFVASELADHLSVALLTGEGSA